MCKTEFLNFPPTPLPNKICFYGHRCHVNCSSVQLLRPKFLVPSSNPFFLSYLIIWKEIPLASPSMISRLWSLLTNSLPPLWSEPPHLSYMLLKSPPNWSFCFCPHSLTVCSQCHSQFSFSNTFEHFTSVHRKMKVLMRAYSALRDLRLLWPRLLFTLSLTTVASLLLLKHIR